MEHQKQDLPRIDSDLFVGIYMYGMVYSLYTPRKSANDWSPHIVKFLLLNISNDAWWVLFL